MKLPFLLAGTCCAAVALVACDPSTNAARTEPSSVDSVQPKQKPPATKPGYIVFFREKTLDRAELEAYWKEAPATLEGHPIKVLSGYGPHEVWEGDNVEGVVIAEFPSMEAARAWYHSSAYQKAREHRIKGAVYRGMCSAQVIIRVPADSKTTNRALKKRHGLRFPPQPVFLTGDGQADLQLNQAVFGCSGFGVRVPRASFVGVRACSHGFDGRSLSGIQRGRSGKGNVRDGSKYRRIRAKLGDRSISTCASVCLVRWPDWIRVLRSSHGAKEKT